jgi:anaerobic magnesium-protoporphyrin IX monomethyl ester cyclase
MQNLSTQPNSINMTKIIPILAEKKIEDLGLVETEDKHVQIAKEIEKIVAGNKTNRQKNLTPVPMHQATRTNRIALVLAPMWGPQIAPYGIARMAGLSRHLGFETKCWDINVQCYSKMPEMWSHLIDWKWASEEFYKKDIHPQIENLLEKFLAELIIFNPTVIGFTIYYTNINCTTWLIDKIKQKLPHIKIIAGGPEARTLHPANPRSDQFDYVVSGEGEIIFSQLLEDIENKTQDLPKFFEHNKSVRIDLDSVPIPDYRDFTMSLYQFRGIAGEMSRGCIAKCTFCSETTFWKYRGRLSMSVLDEVEYNYKTFGIETIWFIDSLVNGNLKELLSFCQGLIDRNIKILWWGFCRNDGRMTKEYLKTLLDSGCMGLAIGIESGSQKVIDLIDKKVKVSEIEQNFRDLAELGSFSTGTSWFVGFPGEMPVDFAQSMTLVWRLRNAGLQNKGFGTCNLAPDSPITTQREKYNISYSNYGGQWRTNDWTNTVIHRAIRYKCVNILMNHYRLHKARNEVKGWRGEQLGFLSHYTLDYNPENWQDNIPFETEFDFDIIKTDINPLADSLVNEIWPLLRVLWLAMGAFNIEVKFDPELDQPVLGTFRYFPPGQGGLVANYKFNIDKDGNWSADFYNKLDSTTHEDNQNFEFSWQGSGIWTR